MPYVLGIHLGATVTSAAIARREGSQWGAAVPLPLGESGPTVPTVLCKVQDGSFVAGDAAQRQALTHHEWVVRGFARHVGDDAPLMVGSDFIPAHQLAATMIEWVADLVAYRQGHPPDHIAVAHRAAWGPYRIHLVHQALSQLGLSDVTLLPEPVAVGVDYASKQAVDDEATIAVANMGGSGFDATVLRRRGTGFEVVGLPLELDHPSGQELDDEIFEHVRGELGDHLSDVDLDETGDRAALFDLRSRCTRAKEALTFQPECTIGADLPGGHREVGLTRSRFEQLARPHLERVPELLVQAVQSALLQPEDLDAVVLAGGSTRAPLLQQLVAQRLKSQPQVDVAPELVAARGAATSAVDAVATHTDRAAVAETSVLMRVGDDDSADRGRGELAGVERDWADAGSSAPKDPPPAPPRPAVEVEPMYLEEEPEDRKRMIKIAKLSVAAILIIVGIVLTVMQQSGGSAQKPAPGVLQQQR
jgi:molecular chaperone DnaK (HSP70)